MGSFILLCQFFGKIQTIPKQTLANLSWAGPGLACGGHNIFRKISRIISSASRYQPMAGPRARFTKIRE